MIFIACNKCNHALFVSGDEREVSILVGPNSDFWPDKYRCASCGTLGAQACLSPEVDPVVLATRIVSNVTAEEAFAALNGLGLPEERVCSEELIEALFERQGIKVKGRQLCGNLPRYILDSLTFADGTCVHLGASSYGAILYRVVKPHSYVDAVADKTESMNAT